MIVREALSQARQALATQGIEDAGLEAEILLRQALKLNRVQLYLQFDNELGAEETEELARLTRRRLDGEPAAYITGQREFYGLDFSVTPDVLIPRPETELLVEAALEFARKRSASTIADIGTGSGAVAISLALNLPEARIYATDISPSALQIAQVNCRKHGVTDKVILLHGDLLDPVPAPVDLIVANLPYVREGELALVNTRPFEPSLALNGGVDGLEVIRRLGAQVSDKLCPGGILFLEIGLGQGETATGFFRHLLPTAVIQLLPDLNSIDRVMSLLLPSAMPAAESLPGSCRSGRTRNPSR